MHVVWLKCFHSEIILYYVSGGFVSDFNKLECLESLSSGQWQKMAALSWGQSYSHIWKLSCVWLWMGVRRRKLGLLGTYTRHSGAKFKGQCKADEVKTGRGGETSVSLGLGFHGRVFFLLFWALRQESDL